MKRIAEALKQVPGGIVVTGHTDNVRIRTASFPSNWHLSEERAKSVRELLISRKVTAERVRAEGRADGESLAPNDTPANRALNRRVEVTLFVPRTDAAATAPATAPAAPAASKP
jgi:type VI secretion system protein ImpK